MFGLSTQAHKKNIQSVRRQLKKIASPSILASCNKTVELFFGGMSVDEILVHDNKHWAHVIVDFVKAIKKNPADSSIIRVFNPDVKKQGFENNNTIIQIVCQDMPFLVDSIALVFSKLGLDMILMTHPIAKVNRTKSGVLKGLGGDEKESWMHIEINKIIDDKFMKELFSEVELVINKVQACVTDWQAMLSAMNSAKDQLIDMGDKKTYSKQKQFIDWLLDNNFTFLGYQYYSTQTAGRTKVLKPQKKSALGLYHSEKYLQTINDIMSKDYHVYRQSDLMIITKLNDRPLIHRAGSLDYIGVLETNKKGDVNGEHRFVGLFTSAAINTRPWDIPYINDKVNGVIKRFKFESSSHTGKHIVHIMETLPRDELMQSSSDELFNTIYSILTIQERQKSNVTVRQDKFKRFYAFLVHIPRDKFNTHVRQTIQNILAKEVDGNHIEFQVKIEDANLTRLYVTVYTQSQVAIDTKQIEDKIAHALRSWQDELEDILIEKHGEKPGYELACKYANKFPMSYVDDVSPRVAAYDVENIAKLSETDDLQLSLYRPRDVSSKLFRFKIFRNNNTIPLSEVLPILENLGLHVVRERPYELSLDNGSSIWIQDFDLALAHGAELELDLVKERFKGAFKQIVHGQVDNDGFNKLLILGGLDFRQIIILRAISKYLKQTNLPFSQEYLEKALIAQSHIARWLIELFEVKFAIRFDDMSSKEHKEYMSLIYI
jgi:glutamate dehydrogenase